MYSPQAVISGPSPPLPTTAAAAPSPNRAVAEGQPAQLDHQEQYAAFGLGLGERGGPREADNAAGVAEAEDGQPLNIPRQPQALDH